MLRKPFQLVILICLFVCISCSEKIVTSDYYFQPEMFKSSKVYTFKSVENPTKVQYWKISTTAKNTLFIIRNTSKNQLIDELKEELSDRGSKMVSYFKSYTQNNEWIQNTRFYPKENDLMKWNLKDTAVYEGEFVIKGHILNLRRERRFLEKSTLNLLSNTYEVLVFKDQFTLESLTDPTPKVKMWYDHDGNDFVQYSYFAKGIGLVKFKREFENGQIDTMELTDIQ